MTSPPPPKPTWDCCVCEKRTSQRCPGCKALYFCGDACQKLVWPTHKLVCQSYSLDATCFRQPDLTRAETDAYCRDPTVREQMKVHLMIKPGEDVEQVIWTYMQELHNEPPPGVPVCAASLETRSKRRWRFRGPLNNEIADGNDLGKTATPFVELCNYARASWIGDEQETMLFDDGVPDSETNEFMRQTLIYLTLKYQARRKKVDMATVELAFERVRVAVHMAAAPMGDNETRPSNIMCCVMTIVVQWFSFCKKMKYASGKTGIADRVEARWKELHAP
ncbi:hypothetical protein RQP46_000088 [Phenoliferia psychrophenolica]